MPAHFGDEPGSFGLAPASPFWPTGCPTLRVMSVLVMQGAAPSTAHEDVATAGAPCRPPCFPVCSSMCRAGDCRPVVLFGRPGLADIGVVRDLVCVLVVALSPPPPPPVPHDVSHSPGIVLRCCVGDTQSSRVQSREGGTGTPVQKAGECISYGSTSILGHSLGAEAPFGRARAQTVQPPEHFGQRESGYLAIHKKARDTTRKKKARNAMKSFRPKQLTENRSDNLINNPSQQLRKNPAQNTPLVAPLSH